MAIYQYFKGARSRRHSFFFLYILYLHMYLHYNYFLHDAYTKLTCTTYDTYIIMQLHLLN